MKRSTVLFTLLIVIWTLGGCGDADGGKGAAESTFLADFSLGPVLEANEQYLIAMHTISGGAVSEPPESFFQKHEEASIQVDETNVSALMEAVRSDIEQLLASSGAQIAGRGRGGNDGKTPAGALPNVDYFSIRYSVDETEGVINVWGVHDNGTHFVFLVLITESVGA
jgi:hypothetical protein